MERVPEDVFPFLWPDRVNVTDAIRLAALLPTDDNTVPAPENIPEADQASPSQGQLEHNKMATGVANTHASVWIPRELPVTLFLLFEVQFFESFAIAVLFHIINKKIVPGEVVTYRKFLQWIGLWLFIATIQGPKQQNIGQRTNIKISEQHVV